MKKYYLIISLLLAFSCEAAMGQTHIYERYASHDDLEVAYVENFSTDSVNTVNATIIIAKDCAAWEWLKEEFRIPPPAFPINAGSIRGMLRDKNDPTKDRREDILNNCIVLVRYFHKSLFIIQYETIDQYKSTIHFSTQMVKHEKD